MKSRLAINAGLNVLAGASGALFAFLVPILLARRISSPELSIWTIVLQTTAYATPFALGIQGVLARHVAVHSQRRDAAAIHATIGTAFSILGLAALVYVVVGCLVASQLGSLYPAIPTAKLAEAQLAFVVFVVGQASQIPATAITGYFFGIQQNAAVTVNVLGSKVVASLAIVLLSTRVDLVTLAFAANAVTVAANGLLLLAYRRSAGRLFPSTHRAATGRRQSMIPLLRECGPMCVWTVATFIVYGGTSSIASALDFDRFPAYSIAAAAALVLMGLHTAAMNPLIPHVAVVNEQGGAPAVGRTLSRASRLSAALSAAGILACAAVAVPLIQLLLPEPLAGITSTLLPLMLFGNAIRLLALPYSCTLIGLGLQGKILLAPAVEAIAAFGSALMLGYWFGLPGVAAGIAVGGVVVNGLLFVVYMPRTRGSVPVRRLQTLAHATLIIGPAIGLYWFMVSHAAP